MNLITNETSKENSGIKCWFIHVACIEESVTAILQIQNRKDIVFISWLKIHQNSRAFNKKTAIVSVVPNLKEYMNKTLQINGFSYSFYSAKCKE
jgi:hypothetical protein